MILTEAEAAAKRCPLSYAAADGVNPGGFAEVVPGPAYSAGGFAGFHSARQCAPLYCIGSACMAWRWHWQVMPDGTHQHVLSAETDQRLGCCGMAGKP